MFRLDKRVFAVIVTAGLLCARASAQHPTIGTCTTIDKPGSYKLEKVITATANDLISYPVPFAPNNLLACIVISADFVTLDMQGYTIIGPGSGNGIANVPPTRAATVHNGTVTQFTNGIVLFGRGHTVEKVQAVANTNNGISMGAFDEAGRFEHVAASVRQSHANGNGGIGIIISSAGGSVIGNLAERNGFTSGGAGIQIFCPGVILENVAFGNASGEIVQFPPGPTPCTTGTTPPGAENYPPS
jgi:hypothetical protein